MGYLDDLKDHERDHPGEDREFAKKFFRERKPQKPDKLHDYRDKRMNGPDGMVRLEPEYT